MLKNVIKRFISACLAFALICSVFPVINRVEASYSGSLNVEGLSVASGSEDEGTWNGSGTSINGSAATTSQTSCGKTTYTAKTGTLILTNQSGEERVLSFDATLELNGGTASINGEDASAGHYSFTLSNGEDVTISITSSSQATNTTKISLTNIALNAVTDVSVTFVPAEHGSYTVDGTTITESTSISKLSSEAYTLNATAASGYKFYCWFSNTNNSPISKSATTELLFNTSQEITAKFIPSNTPVFQVGLNTFIDLNEAIDYAVSNNVGKIVLIENGTLPSGTYTIPNGKTLLIPFDDAQTVYTTAPEVVYGSHANPSAFRTLTMANGANLVIANGAALCVPSKLSATGTNSGSWNGTPTGKHGRITMNAGSSIDLQSGGKLYAYGYISGSGNVYARSGSEVWECFQIRCWRGGTATSGMAGNNQKVFPINQYYVQNIEAPLTFYPGATEKVYTAVNMSSKAYVASATFIGSGGMFSITNGSVTKHFTGASDRLELNVNGDFSITPMSLRITGLPLIGTLDLNTNSYVLPINSNISINVKSGTTTLSQDVAFLPGTEMSIDAGASVSVASGHKAYVYDKDQWGAYAAANLQLVPVGYSTVNGTTTKRTAASLIDSKIDVNGTLNVAGSLYTTESGAAIVSSGGTGKVVLQANAGTETTTYQATQSGSDITYVEIPITAAKLQHADGTYYETAGKPAGTEIPYSNGFWGAPPVPTYTVKFWLNAEAEAPLKTYELEEGTQPIYDGETPVKEADLYFSYEFDGWQLEGSGEVYTAETLPVATADASYYAHFAAEPRKYDVTWKVDGQEDLVEQYEYSEVPTYPYHTPEKASDENYTYSFAGWKDEAGTVYGMNDELPPVTGDAVYTAVFSTSLVNDYYLIGLHGWTAADLRPEDKLTENPANASEMMLDQVTLQVGDKFKVVYLNNGELTWYPDGTNNEYKVDENHAGEKTVYFRPNGDGGSDWHYGVIFVPATYTVKFWLNESDEAPIQTVRVEQGERPAYVGDAPVKEADAQYTYTFDGWTREADETVYTNETFPGTFKDVSYYAHFQQTVNTYTVTWNNDDGTQLEVDENVPYGTTPSYDGQTPTKAADAQYSYTFAGWSPKLSAVTGNVTYTATYTSTVNTYTVTWKNEDGTVLETDKNVPYGTIPTYDGETPTKAGNAQYSYEFAGWNPSVAEVTGNAVYTATYTEITNSYTVTWNNYDGTELEVDENVPYGAEPSYDGEEPVKPSDEQYKYVFAGWTPAVSAVTGNVTYTATFTSEKRSYTIRFVNDNGDVLYSNEFEYGTVPVYVGDTPVKEGDAQYSYTFTGWTPAIVAVHGDATYTAVFDATVNKYLITFVNEDGRELYSAMVAYGDTPVYGGETPTKTNTAQYTYTFAGWDPEIVTVTGEATYKAVFDAEVNEYLIRFVNYNGDLLYSDMFAYGATPVYDGDTPAKEGNAQYSYTFTGWDPEIEAVTGEATYTATYEQVTNEYRIRFVNEDGTELYSAKFAYGEQPVYGGPEPAKQAGENETGTYRFIGWEPELSEVTGDKTYTAKFSYTGFRSDEQGLRYYVDDEMQTGLVLADGETYYMDPDTGYAVTGLVRLVLESGEVNYYYFTENYQAVKDGTYKVDNNNGLPLPCFNYKFDENGVIEHDPDTSKNGLSVPSDNPNGLYYMIDGIKVGMGLLQINGSYYYARTSTGEIVRGKTYYVSVTNGLPIEPGMYSFDAEGRMILNGFFDENGSTYYYENGVMAKGFTKIGEDYYFFNAGNGRMYKNIKLWVPDNDYGVEPGYYDFDADGKMEPKNGFVEEGGYSYYYVNGERAKGFTKIGEDYYFFNAGNGRMYKDIKLWVPENEYGVEPGYYDFNAEGKMILPTVKNGFVKENGSTYYYVDGEMAKGLTKIGEYFYFFNQSSGKMYKSMKLWVADHPEYGIVGGMYQFDEEGKMVLPG